MCWATILDWHDDAQQASGSDMVKMDSLISWVGLKVMVGLGLESVNGCELGLERSSCLTERCRFR